MANKTTPGKTLAGVKRAAAAGRVRKGGKKKNQRVRVGSILFGVLVGLAAIAIAFFIYVKVQGEISLPENAVGSLVSPVQNAVSGVTGWVRDKFSDLVNAGKVDLDHKISHTYHFTDAQAAFDFNDTRDPSIRKIVLTMD